MKSFLILFIFVIGIGHADAMSCEGYGTATEVAQDPAALVVKVELVKKSNDDSGELKVLKTYKGDASIKHISIDVDEMGYGNAVTGRALNEQWIETFLVDNDKFYSVGCAVSVFNINAQNKIGVQIGHGQLLELTEDEFSNYINLVSKPKFKGVTCSLEFADQSDVMITKEFNVTEFDQNSPFASFEIDMSVHNSNYKELSASVSLSASDQLYSSVTDPVTGRIFSSSFYLMEQNGFADYSINVVSETYDSHVLLSCYNQYDTKLN